MWDLCGVSSTCPRPQQTSDRYWSEPRRHQQLLVVPIPATGSCRALLSWFLTATLFCQLWLQICYHLCAHPWNHNWKKCWSGSCCLEVSSSASPFRLVPSYEVQQFVIPSWRQARLVVHKIPTVSIKENISTAKAILPWMQWNRTIEMQRRLLWKEPAHWPNLWEKY